jgi:integrase/recombinase XerD
LQYILKKSAALIARIKKLEGARWSQSLQAWHLPDTKEHRKRFLIAPHSHSLPSTEGSVQIEKFRQWLHSKRYSQSTIATYSEALKSFLVFYREKPVAAINNEDVIIFNNDYILQKKLSASY